MLKHLNTQLYMIRVELTNYIINTFELILIKLTPIIKIGVKT